MRYYVIGDEDAVLGFGLAGVRGTVVSTAAECARAFAEAVADPATGIVLITERMADLIRGEVDRYLFSESFPLVLEIQDREGRLPDKAGLREMANAAIGIKL